MMPPTDLAAGTLVAWTARPGGRILSLATADQDRPGLTGLFLLDGRTWRNLVRRSPQEMLAEVLGDGAIAAALVATHDRPTTRRLTVEG